MSREHPVLTLMGGVAIGGTLATFTLWRYWKPIYKAYTHEGVGVGILGTGWGVKVQVPRFREAGLRILALYSRDKDRGNQIAEKAKILCAFTEVHALCQVNEVELVSVVTPPYLHLEHTLAALDSGKHVLVEKPLAVTSEDGEAMVAAAAARPDLLAIVDHECRFSPAFLRAREHLRKGTIGAVLSVAISAHVFKPPIPNAPFTWWQDRSLGGGAWAAFGSHMVDALRFLLDAEVMEVAAYLRATYPTGLGPDGKEKAITSDDYASVQMKLGPRDTKIKSPSFEGPQPFINAHATLSAVGASKAGSGIVIIGSKGGLEITFINSSLSVNDINGKVVDKVASGGGHMFAQLGTRLLGKAVQTALGPKKDRSALEPAATLEDGLAALYVLEAGWKSSDNGSIWVTPKRLTPHPAPIPAPAPAPGPAPTPSTAPVAGPPEDAAPAASTTTPDKAPPPGMGPGDAASAPATPPPSTPAATPAAPEAPAAAPLAAEPALPSPGPPKRSQSTSAAGDGAKTMSPRVNPKFKPSRQG